MDFISIVIKADAVRDCLECLILEDLVEMTGIAILFRKYFQFSEQDVGRLYPTWYDKPVFPYMKRNLTQGPSLVVFACGPDALSRVVTAKGKMNSGGLRAKYKVHTLEGMTAAGLAEDELQTRIAENRLHNTDNMDELKVVSEICLKPSELAEIKEKSPELYRLMVGFQTLTKLRQ